MVTNRKKFVNFKISPKNISAKFKAQWRFISKEEQKIFEDIGKAGEKRMKALAPVRTGRLRGSIKAKIVKTGSGGIDGRTDIIIGSDGSVPYARYQNDGTGPSPGAFIPRLGKRFKKSNPIGIHGGFKGHFFVEKTRDFVDKLIDEKVPSAIRNAIKKSRSKGR